MMPPGGLVEPLTPSLDGRKRFACTRSFFSRSLRSADHGAFVWRAQAADVRGVQRGNRALSSVVATQRAASFARGEELEGRGRAGKHQNDAD